MPRSKVVVRLKSAARRSLRHEWRKKSERLSECANCKIEKRTIQKDGRPSVSYGKKGAVAASKVAPNCIYSGGRVSSDQVRAATQSAARPTARPTTRATEKKVAGMVVIVNTVRPLLYAADDVQRLLSIDEAGLATAVESGKLKAPLEGGRWCLADLEDYVSGLRIDRHKVVSRSRPPTLAEVDADPSPAPKATDAPVDIVYGGAAERNAVPHSGDSAS